VSPAAEAVVRFAADLNVLLGREERLGVAVSGGPDSIALLLLAAAARPGLVSAASVDHSLREGSCDEAEMVATMCADIGVAHDILTVDWPTKPTSALQEQARDARYAALARWAEARGLSAVATGHHADDQAETLLMRLMRGAGVRGLAAMRPASPLPGNSRLKLIRPLLGWRREELAAVVADAGLTAASDPSNQDEQHERVRIRRQIAASAWIDPAALAASAAHLGAADEAIEYAAALEYERVQSDGETVHFAPRDTPAELRRRVTARIIAALASEGDAGALRGRELDRLLVQIERGSSATLRGVVAEGGPIWRFRRAPPRR
jgi:tRNA(Ile)-lysidine synthase